jgi:pyridinium-3,5-biscarboxylic acid mononucleotide synthase
MDAERLRELLLAVQGGTLDLDAALARLSALPFSDIGYARVDHHRALRHGISEVVLAEGKTAEHVIGIVHRLLEAGENVFITRLFGKNSDEVRRAVPELRYAELARTGSVVQREIPLLPGHPVAVVTAGTSDIPVAEEALETLAMFGIRAARFFDVGVSGLHRLVGSLEEIARAPAVIVVAGMEGALPSVVGGMIGAPVIAVPTSTGYGTALAGFTALFGMLTSCASGVSVVNIDNGFGAAMAAARIVSAMKRNEARA